MFDLVRGDLRRAKECSVSINQKGLTAWLRLLFHPGVTAVLIYRYGSWVYRLRIPVVRQILLITYWPLRAIQLFVCQVSISAGAQIGPGFVVHNWGGVFIPPVKAGKNLYISTGVVIGYAVRSIGDDVAFAVGAKAHGPISIGSNVSIGANAVVSFNVPDDRLVLTPAPRIVPRAFFGDRKDGQGETKTNPVAGP